MNVPARVLPAPETVDSRKIVDCLRSMQAKVSPRWADNTSHELHVVAKATEVFGPEFEDFMALYPDEFRRAIFEDGCIVTTQAVSFEKAIQTGYTHAHSCYDKTPRPISSILREVRDLSAAGLIATEILWKYDPWTGTISACSRPLVYHCSIIH